MRENAKNTTRKEEEEKNNFYKRALRGNTPPCRHNANFVLEASSSNREKGFVSTTVAAENPAGKRVRSAASSNAMRTSSGGSDSLSTARAASVSAFLRILMPINLIADSASSFTRTPIVQAALSDCPDRYRISFLPSESLNREFPFHLKFIPCLIRGRAFV